MNDPPDFELATGLRSLIL